MAERPYRAALIGCGHMGRNHALALASTPGLELRALADVHQPSLDRIGDEVGVEPARRYVDHEALLDAEQLDFVVIATRAEQHAATTIAAAAHGVHVLCEKPLAPTLAEADAMVAACRSAGVRLAVDHLRRITPAARVARDMIAEGAIGDVIGTRRSLTLRGGTNVQLYRRRGHAWATHDQPELVETPALDAHPGEGPAVTHCRAMARELVAAIEEGREHVSSGRDGLAVLEAIMAVYASHQVGRPVTLPLADRRHPLEAWRTVVPA